MLILKSEIANITSEAAGLIMLQYTHQKSVRCVLTSSEHSRHSQADEPLEGRQLGQVME
jgi:hypothetical protein